MTSAMLHGDERGRPPAAPSPRAAPSRSCWRCGPTATTRADRGVTEPEIVVPVTAHAAFDKAGQYFGIRLVRTSAVGDDMRADVAAVRAAITDRTVAVVGSAVQFPHGVVDPIEETGRDRGGARDRLAHRRLPRRVRPAVGRAARLSGAPFDFRVPGVTSMSCDTHKFGYAAKGTSVLLWRDAELRERPVLHHHRLAGRPLLLADVRRQPARSAVGRGVGGDGDHRRGRVPRRDAPGAGGGRRGSASGIAGIPGLRVLGDPLWVIAFTSEGTTSTTCWTGWPAGMEPQRAAAPGRRAHLRHAAARGQDGVVDRLLADLAAMRGQARQEPGGGSSRPSTAWPPLRRREGEVDEHPSHLLRRPLPELTAPPRADSSTAGWIGSTSMSRRSAL